MIGHALAHYEILEKLGEGGMGLVYKARDKHLDRFVAIKILPADRVADANRKQRFVQEAKAASALSHQNIVHVYDISEAGGVDFIAMEYVSGKTLDRLIPRHGMRPGEALKYAVQIADALAAAHSAGIVHRDLKPGNVMITEQGLVKVLDFGLAKLRPLHGRPSWHPTWNRFELAEAAAGSAEDATCTLKQALTGEGTILGTAAYMSPEQAEGKPVDARSDIFSFGSLLYEMLTGQRAFRGDTQASTIAAILREDSKPPSQVVEGVPAELERIVVRCLRKDPARRFQHTDDLKIALEELKEAESGVRGEPDPARAPRKPTKRLLLLAVAVAFVLIGAALFLRPPTTPRLGTVVAITNDGHIKFPSRLVSDGSRLYFIERVGGRNALMEIPLRGGGQARRLASSFTGPLSQILLFDISPDGQELLIGSAGADVADSLWLLRIAGGTLRRIAGLPGAIDASFSRDSKWLAVASAHGILIGHADGSDLRFAMLRNAGPVNSVRWSADAKRIIYSSYNPATDRVALWECNTDGRGARELFPTLAGDQYAPGLDPELPKLVFVADGQLWTAALQGRSWNSVRSPVRLTSGPLTFSEPLIVGNGVYAVGELARGELVRFDRKTAAWTPFLEGISADGVDFSADGQWVVYVTYPQGEVWRSRIDGSQRLQLTSAPMKANLPRWSPDGGRIAFMGHTQGNPWRIYVTARDGGQPEELVRDVGSVHDPNWAPDGGSIVFAAYPQSASGVFTYDLRARKSSALPGSQRFWSPRWSPDGKYIAALDRESDQVHLFDVRSGIWSTVSSEPVGFPSWSRSSRWLYFLPVSGPDEIARCNVYTREREHVASLAGMRLAGAMGPFWAGLSPDGSPLVLRDIGVQEIYSLDLESGR